MIGAALYWVIYPIGALISIIIAESLAHSIRFFTFKYYIFPAIDGYEVTAKKYLLTITPASLASLLITTLFGEALGRSLSTITIVSVSFSVGLLGGATIFRKKTSYSNKH